MIDNKLTRKAKRIFRKTGVFAGALLLGVSGYAVLKNVADQNADWFNRAKVLVGKDVVSIQNFYDSLSYEGNSWFYVDAKGCKINVDSLCDAKYINHMKHKHLETADVHVKIDTVYVYCDDDSNSTKKSTKYVLGQSDTLSVIPGLGLHNYNLITIREFVADNSELQKWVDQYNDKYNCTYRHELQHYYNMKAGMRNWNSYEIKFVECCLDEVSASIAQCLEQCKNYNKHGKDERYLTDRFMFLKKAVRDGVIDISGDLSEKEQAYIANQVFEEWMQRRYAYYEEKCYDRAKLYLKDAVYHALKPDWQEHENLMQKCFNINGYDFWKYIKPQQNEVFARISSDKHNQFAKYMRNKKMYHFDKLEHIRLDKGRKSYNKQIAENVLTSKIIKIMGRKK